MRYIIKHACGHSEEFSLYGNTERQETKKKELEGQICENCKRSKETAEADLFTIERKLPELVGTDKQKAWAKVLRMKIILNAEKSFEEQKENNKNKIDENKMNEFMSWLNNKRGSKFWISKRFLKTESIVEIYLKELKGEDVE